MCGISISFEKAEIETLVSFDSYVLSSTSLRF